MLGRSRHQLSQVLGLGSTSQLWPSSSDLLPPVLGTWQCRSRLRTPTQDTALAHKAHELRCRPGHVQQGQMEGGHHNSSTSTDSRKLFAPPVPRSQDFCFLAKSTFVRVLQKCALQLLLVVHTAVFLLCPSYLQSKARLPSTLQQARVCVQLVTVPQVTSGDFIKCAMHWKTCESTS